MGFYEKINNEYVKKSSLLVGKSAYDIAVDEGFVGTKSEWLASLKTAIPVSVVVPVTGWSGSVPYSITLACNGVLDTDMIMWDVDIPLDSSASAVTDMLASYQLIDTIRAGTNTITLYCWSSIPVTEVTLNLAVIRI